MRRTLTIATLVLAGLAGAMLLWAQSVLGQDAVRSALASQLSAAVGQPVTIGGIRAGIFPRVTVHLSEVSIGEPARARISSLMVGTRLRALVSRRIENATLTLDGARIELPLTVAGSKTGGSTSGAPVELVSVDEIRIRDVEIVSGGRTLKGSLEAALAGPGLTLQRAQLTAEDTSLEATGQLTDWSAPAGEITIKAGQMDLNRLLAFLADFSASLQPSPPATPSPAAGSPDAAASTMDLRLAIEAESASSGRLTLTSLNGRARVTSDEVSMDPVSFNVFGGRYQGLLALTLDGDEPRFRYQAQLSGIDTAAAMDYAGQSGTMSGRLTGTIDLAGPGADFAAVMRRARGKARVDIADGVIKGLGLVRSIVIATSGRTGAVQNAGGSSDEPFTRLGATLTITNGAASTNDLRFESENLIMDAAGAVRLDGKAVNLQGAVQLSEELTKQAGTDLVRYTQEQGRVTLPVLITGSAQNLSVRVNTVDLARRAITNRATEEIKKQLGGIFGR
jgi:uncharacterized protein involved in outer membrane biogenesis